MVNKVAKIFNWPKYAIKLLLFPVRGPSEQLDPEDWRRVHDEASRTIRRQITALVIVSLFCIMTLLAPDIELIDLSPTVKLPFTNTNVPYQWFLFFGPMIIIVINTYTHLFIEVLIKLEKRPVACALPFVFNFAGRRAKLLSNYMFYWLVPTVLFIFCWKSGPLPLGTAFLVFSIIVSVYIVIIRIRHFHLKHGGRRDWLFRPYSMWLLILFVLYGLPVMQGKIFNRPLILNDVDLSGRNMRNYSFADAYLRNANLSHADFQYTNMSGADLTNANLNLASLQFANFYGANFTYANLKHASFQSAKVINAQFSGADLTNTNFEYADLTNSYFGNTNLRDTRLAHANLSGVDFGNADLRGVRDISCSDLKKAKSWKNSRRDPRLACNN